MKRSFTLIELIVVIAIIAVLAAIIAPNAFRAIEKAKVAQVIKSLDAIKVAAITFRTDVGLWPGSQWGIMPGDPLSQARYGEGFVDPPGVYSGSTSEQAAAQKLVRNWNGPYLEKWSRTPWGILYLWDFNNWDASGDGIGPEHVVWLDFVASPGPYDNKKVPPSSRDKLDFDIDGGDGLSAGHIQQMDNGFYGISLMVIVQQGD